MWLRSQHVAQEGYVARKSQCVWTDRKNWLFKYLDFIY